MSLRPCLVFLGETGHQSTSGVGDRMLETPTTGCCQSFPFEHWGENMIVI